MLNEDINVAIIGAGPVGLTMARLLQQGGAQVAVYERDTNARARIWGGTLDLHKDSGQAALDKAGLLEKYYSLSLPMGIKFADAKGAILATKGLTPENQSDNPEINRNALRMLLLDSLAPGTVRWDRKLSGLEVHNGKWQLFFENKTNTSSDLVIVANGGMSKVRRLVTSAKTKETGSFIVQGDIPNPEVNCAEFYQLCDAHRLMVAHDGNLLVANPLNNGSLTYGFIFKKPPYWNEGRAPDFNNNKDATDYLVSRIANWSDLYKQLIQSTTKFVGLPSRVLPLNQVWKADRPLPITLIGDAAHLMPPFAGMGVNIGLVDAMNLSEKLLGSEFRTIQAAIAAYETEMFNYAKAAAKESLENEIKMCDPGFDFRQLIF